MRDWLVLPVLFPIFLVLPILPATAILRTADVTAAHAAEGFAMNVPKDTKPMIWGAVVGAAACAILGFAWGGWVTGATARKDAGVAAHNATVIALAPFCAERFRAQGDAPAKMAELAKASTWERATWSRRADLPSCRGPSPTDTDIARACVELLLAPLTPKT